MSLYLVRQPRTVEVSQTIEDRFHVVLVESLIGVTNFCTNSTRFVKKLVTLVGVIVKAGVEQIFKDENIRFRILGIFSLKNYWFNNFYNFLN